MQDHQYPENVELKREIIKNFCRNLETELIAGMEEGRTVSVDVMHRKNDLISTGMIRIDVALPMDLEGGFISLEDKVDNFKFHKDL